MLAREAARDDEFCAHWRGREGSIAHAMLLNDRAGRALLAGVDTSRTRVFTDMEVTHDDLYVHAYLDYWRRLRAEHPAARFVLNTRREDDWTRSRLRWQGGDYARRWARHHGVDPGDADAVAAAMVAERRAHHAEVAAAFADEPARLLVFDIDEHHPDAFREFLGVAPTGPPMPHAKVPPPQDWWE